MPCGVYIGGETIMNDFRVQEKKETLIRDAENRVVAKFIGLYGNGVLAESKADLTQVAGKTDSDIVFDGTITVGLSVIHSKGTKGISVPVKVAASEIELPEDKELDATVEAAEEVVAEDDSAAIAIAEAFPVKASLDGFKVYDDGSKFLKIYHPALDSGKELGIVSKDEYSSLSDKEAFFKDVLENQIKNSSLESHYELSFEGTFVEPTVEVKAAAEEIVTANDLSETKETVEAPEVVVEAEDDKENLFLAHSSNGYEQSLQFEAQKTEADVRRLATQVANDMVSHLRSLKYDDVKVLAVEQPEPSIFQVTASLIDSAGEKIITLNVPVRDDAYTLPKKELVADLVSKTVDLQSKIGESIAKDTLEKTTLIDEIEEEQAQELEAALAPVKIEKTAGGDVGGVQFIGPVDVLNMDKHTLASSGIPEDLEIGSVIYADGFHWKLTSKNKDNISKEADSGSVWTFTKVPPTDKAPEHEVVA